jgi:predicted adenylyl cyclase CyaB
MPSNVEIKTVLRDPAAAHRIAARLSGGPPRLIAQQDVFFRCPAGRLKLRIFDSGEGELILYNREDEAAARRSDYMIARTPDAATLRQILERTEGSIGTVRKTRSLYLVGQTRIHIDDVKSLGDFLEIEVVLQHGQSVTEGQRISDDLLREFGITPDQHVACSYFDLLTAGSP